jgi:hypothetical protein
LYPDAPGGLPSSIPSSTSSYIDPEESDPPLRRADGSDSMRSHGPRFYEHVAEMVHSYSRRIRSSMRLSRDDFAALNALRRRGLTTFRNFPSFPQRYMERLECRRRKAAYASSRSSR